MPLGDGAVTDNNQPESWSGVHIAGKEMVTVIISVAIWDEEWASSLLMVMSDKMAVVHGAWQLVDGRASQRSDANEPVALPTLFHSQYKGQQYTRNLEHSSRCVVTKQ